MDESKTCHLIRACAGAGKTRYLVEQVARLCESKDTKDSGECMLMTFTRHAAQEMKNRLKSPPPFLGTFHSVSRMILIETGVWPQGAMAMAPFHVDEFQFLFRDMLKDRHASKPHRVKSEPLHRVLSGVKYLLVDEFQDVNHVQYEIVYNLFEMYVKEVWLVGDQNQNIYRFRKSDSKYMLQCEKEFRAGFGAKTEHHLLDVNHRSTPEIVAVTNAIAKRIDTLSGHSGGPSGSHSSGHSSALTHCTSGRTDSKGVRPVLCLYPNFARLYTDICNKVQQLQKSGVSLSDVCVLARTSFPFEELAAKLRQCLPDIPVLVQSQQHPHHSSVQSESDKALVLSTIHSAKGQEKEHVIVILHGNFFPDPRSPLDEEWRIWYVGASRSKTFLTIYDHAEFRSSLVSELLLDNPELFELDPHTHALYGHLPRNNRKTLKRMEDKPFGWQNVRQQMDGQSFRHIKEHFLPDLTNFFIHPNQTLYLQPEWSMHFACLQLLFHKLFHQVSVGRGINQAVFPIQALVPSKQASGAQKFKDTLSASQLSEELKTLFQVSIQESYIHLLEKQIDLYCSKRPDTTLTYVKLSDTLVPILETKEKQRVGHFAVFDPMREFEIPLLDLIRCIFVSLQGHVDVLVLFHLETLRVSEIHLQNWTLKNDFFVYVSSYQMT